MSTCYIKMENVNLYYPADIYNAMTLKEEVFSRLKLQKRKKILADVHALKDFSLEVHEGERLGVIGFNGAGKSTLLKALAGLYPIRTGKIECIGNIRSMFELSLGFDLESTGRENIVNRGLMLGCTPKEIASLEQEIIDFAELNEFIDYPIRSYSSGMLIRLAFAITTSISGDILLVDEVLSAGDINFQAKAKHRMLNVMNRAKIIVLVLHDMSTVQEVCNRIILLDKGRIIADGNPTDVVKEYLSRGV